MRVIQIGANKDFFLFIKLCETNGRDNYEKILEELPNKTMEELLEYSEVFWSRYPEMESGERYVERIEKGEAEIKKLNDIE